jgi:multicomponent Na+:H+ antiporter subunit A
VGKVIVAVVGPARRMALALAGWIERVDGTLRQWPIAGIALLAVAILLGAAMMAGR